MQSQSLEFRILGPVEAVHGGRLLSLEPKQRSLLALLLLKANRVVSRHELLEQLWPDVAEPKASHSLDVHLSKLRRALGSDKDRLTRRSGGYVLSIEPGELDLERFEQLAAQGRRRLEERRPADALEELRAALDLWRGAPLQGVILDQPGLAVGLDERRLTVLEDRLDADLALGRHGELISELQKLTSLHPLRERLRTQLMLCLYRSGRQSDALELYRHTRELYVSELGIEPGREMQELQKGILRHDPSLEALSAARTALPVPLTSFVDREVELGELRKLVTRKDVRLVTLTGTGGVGKTRLALEAAAGLTGDYPDGVFLVELAPLSDPDLLIDTIGNVLGVMGDGVAAHIGDRRVLLLLDNFEHLLDGAAEVAGLLRACTDLSVLATSRERLRLSGEHVFEVPPLPDQEAVALFTERARAVKRDVSLGAEVAEVCARLDGIPLAIELAAARVADLAPDALVEQLQQRLEVLTEGPRDIPARQQTLRAAIEWSYELLSTEEKVLFVRLSVFAGGCTLDAAEEVAGADLDTLQSLVGKSLLRSSNERFWMLETIGEFAAERLKRSRQAEALKRRHARYFGKLAERLQDRARTSDSSALERLDVEHNNIRAALDWSLAHDVELAEVIVGGMYFFWLTHGHVLEGDRWMQEVLSRSKASTARAAWVVGLAGEFPRARGDVDRAAELKQRSMALLEELGEPRQVAGVMADLAHLLLDQGEHREARALAERTMALRVELGDPRGIAHAREVFIHLALSGGELHEARRLTEENLAACRELELWSEVAENLLALASIEGRLGDPKSALRHLDEALEVAATVGYETIRGEALDQVGAVGDALGLDHLAVRLYAAAEAWRQVSGFVLRWPSEHESRLAALERRIGSEDFAAGWAEGRAWSLDEALDYGRLALNA